MMGWTVTIQEHIERKIKAAEESATFQNFAHAGAKLRKVAQESIETAPREPRKRRVTRGGRKVKTTPGPAGGPIRTRSGQARRAIVFHSTKDSVLIGPRHSVVGVSMEAHEFGGDFRGQVYEERPTMGLALENIIPRLAEEWRGTIGAS